MKERFGPSVPPHPDGGTVLQEGQNFFAQPPFDLIVPHVVDSAGLSQSSIEGLIDAIVKNMSSSFQGKAPIEIRDMMNEKAFYYRRKLNNAAKSQAEYDSSGIEMLQYQTAAAELFGRLRCFPYWIDYVAYKKDRFFYDSGGKFRRLQDDAPLRYTPIESYPVWVLGYIHSNGEYILKKLEPIFPNMDPRQSLEALKGLMAR